MASVLLVRPRRRTYNPHGRPRPRSAHRHDLKLESEAMQREPVEQSPESNRPTSSPSAEARPEGAPQDPPTRTGLLGLTGGAAPSEPSDRPAAEPVPEAPSLERAPDPGAPQAREGWAEAQPAIQAAFERSNMAWPPATWERPASAWRSDLWTGPELVTAPGLEVPASGDEERAARRRRLASMARELVETVVLTLLIFFGIRLLVLNFKIEGMSMEPNLHDGQYLLVNKLSYMGSGEPQRGDVIVFESWSPGKDFIKRVIGLPGDHVEVRDEGVWINGERLDEPYLDQVMYGSDELDLGPDQYYVMGDNRGNSSDSRNHGPLEAENIIGKAWLIYWPIDGIGLIDDAHEVFGAGG